MTKSEFRERIKLLVKQVYKPGSKVDLDSMDNTISLEAEKFPVLLKFPKLKHTLVSLLTNQYEIFVADIQWVAPRPTTFRIVLGNNENFILIYTDRSWIAQVEGKKYYLLNLPEEENAAQAISRILAYGSASIPGEVAEPSDTSVDTGGGNFPGSETSTAEPASTEEPAAEEPAAEEPAAEEA
jgi:hypothetical protein